MKPRKAAFFDFSFILIFVIIGRFNHHDGLSPLGIGTTIWPFLTAAGVGWCLIYLASHVISIDFFKNTFAPWTVPNGVFIWLCTVSIGMTLRSFFGQTIAVSFIIVASITLALFLIGWRLIVAKFSAQF